MSDPRLEPEVHVLPDPGDSVFNEAGQPILAFDGRRGWRLHYLEGMFEDGGPPSTAGVEDYVLGGKIEDLDWALSQARKYLRQLAEQG